MSEGQDNEALLEGSPDVLSRHDASGAFLHASAASRAVFGCEPSELIGRKPSDLCDPGDAAAVKQAFAEALSSERVVVMTYRLRDKDGRERWIEATGRAAPRAGEGREREIVCASRDITARRAASVDPGALQRMSGLIASIPGVVWEAWMNEEENTARASFCSDYILEMTGYTPEEWFSMPEFWLHIMHPDDRPRIMAEMGAVLAKGSGTFEFRWITKDGRPRWTESFLSVARDKSGTFQGVRGVTFDITRRRDAEQEQEQLRDEIIKVQEKTLAELSTPLIPISRSVMVMPLIGALDARRSESVLAALLSGMGRAHAKTAILDITGVPGLDTESAHGLVRAARAVQLLGAEVVLTGIRPEVARMLVELDVDLGTIITRGTLESGIAYAMRQAEGAHSP